MIAEDQLLRTPAPPPKRNEKFLVASQWQLIRWKFARHRVAVISLVILIIFYGVATFAEFFAPYPSDAYDIDYVLNMFDSSYNYNYNSKNEDIESVDLKHLNSNLK